ncbi:hypothetical protein COS66_02205 [Candidatus Berkelbacteria bacterium CG06_land_8_20_14_3_00_43_10]|nr:MAG: hypothetical protein COS66_02205 [Candidatus Berkelbacteria bacterium CG06_land_8_20_14_3_00_43_10]
MKEFFKIILYKPLYNILMVLILLTPQHSLAVGVVALTVLIRIALLPATKSITRQQALMAKVKPELDELQKKHKGDQATLARETMAFYKRHHVSPWGSCLPMILQLVILIILYRVFIAGVATVRTDLLYSFIPNPGTINPFFFGIDLSKPDLWILPVITGLLQFVQTWQMMPKSKKGTTNANDPSAMIQKQMVYVLPVFTVVIARSFPAALPLYWAISSVISIIQQTYILRATAKISLKQADALLGSGADDVTVTETKEVITKKDVEITVRKKKSE